MVQKSIVQNLCSNLVNLSHDFFLKSRLTTFLLLFLGSNLFSQITDKLGLIRLLDETII